MAGYNGFSKSNNAIAAEEAGFLTASAAAKWMKRFGIRVSAKIIAETVRYIERHHTSSHFNCTPYYSKFSLFEKRKELRLAAVVLGEKKEIVHENAHITYLV